MEIEAATIEIEAATPENVAATISTVAATSIGYSGFVAAIDADITLPVPTGSVTITGIVPGLDFDSFIKPDSGRLIFQGQQIDLVDSINAPVGFGDIVFSGRLPFVVTVEAIPSPERTFTVYPQNRLMMVPEQSRLFGVYPDNRLMMVPEQSRVISVYRSDREV